MTFRHLAAEINKPFGFKSGIRADGQALRIDWLGLDHHLIDCGGLGCTRASSIFKWSWVLSIEYKEGQLHWKSSHYNTEAWPLPLRACGPQSKRPTNVPMHSSRQLPHCSIPSWHIHLYFVGLALTDPIHFLQLGLDRCYHNREVVRGYWMRRPRTKQRCP